MILEIREVGRKTPNDGKLEISAGVWRRLQMERVPLAVRVGEAVETGELQQISCRCDAAQGGVHAHHFLASPVLCGLVAGESVVIELAADGAIEVARPHPLGP